MDTLTSQFPGATGLKYLMTDQWIALARSDSFLLPPRDGWKCEERTYFVTAPPINTVFQPDRQLNSVSNAGNSSSNGPFSK